MAADARTDAKPQEYLTDVAYVRQFCGDLSPARLRLAVALNGFRPPPGEEFDYCELGAASGDTTCTLAAAYPRARFVGVDINPEHVAVGNALARRGGLGNVRFLERDFEALRPEDVPELDYVCAHGVWSWIAPAKRRAVLELASARLKPGGLLHVSYNALPGWAAVEPLRRLMLDASAAVAGGSLERARHGLGFAKLLADAGAGYFATNPAARTMLATMLAEGLPYVAHEYFHAHWHPMYFADVAREMAAADLHFIAQLPLYLNYRDLTIPPPLMGLFEGVTDRLAFEGLKDFAVNEFFRRDVYIKGAAARSATSTSEYLDATPFGTLTRAEPLEREVRLPHYTLRFAGPVFDALIPALSERSATVLELSRAPELAAFALERLRESLLHLALGERVVPMQRSTTPALAAEPGRCRAPLAYNRMILEQRLSAEIPIVLASDAAGTGLTIPMLEAVCLRLVTEVEPPGEEAWIRAFVARQPLRLRVGDSSIDGGEAQVRVLTEQLRQFRAKRLPKLLELGILEPA